MPKKAYLAFGSNIGNGKENVREAYASLTLVPGVIPKKLSKMFITKPWGYADQPDFTNACCEIETSLSPEALLGVCLGIEAAMGRKRIIKNGPRIIDIDLILYEGETRNTTELILPHPRYKDRLFVLEPLYDISNNGFILDINLNSLIKILRENAR